MKRLLFFFLASSLLLMFGAVFAVQQMNETLGISSPEPIFNQSSSPVHVEKLEQQPVKEEQAQGKKQDDLLAKQQRSEDVGAFNFFSALGTALGNGMTAMAREGLSGLMTFFQEGLNRGA